MARASDLDKMTYAQLLALEERIKDAIQERKAEDAKAVKEQMAALAEKAGFSVAELFGDRRKGKRGPVAVKYKNPKNPNETWTGRGRKPNWLVAELKRGVKLEGFTA
jgi:DNA-binding protein H-NS